VDERGAVVGGKGKEGGFILYSWVVGRGIVSWQKDRGKKKQKNTIHPPQWKRKATGDFEGEGS